MTHFLDMQILIYAVQINENSQRPIPVIEGWGNAVKRLQKADLVMKNGNEFLPTDKGRKRIYSLSSKLYNDPPSGILQQ